MPSPLFDLDVLAGESEPEELPFTLDDAITRFLNRWCHRALGDRHVAEQELRELIARAVREQ